MKSLRTRWYLGVGFAAAVIAGAQYVKSTCLASDVQKKFVNDTGQAANDLHVVFNQNCSFVGGHPEFTNGSGGQSTSVHDFSGGTGVAAGGSTANPYSFVNGQAGLKIVGSLSYWTKDGARIGTFHLGPESVDPWDDI